MNVTHFLSVNLTLAAVVSGISLATLAGCKSAAKPANPPATATLLPVSITEAVNSTYRSPENRARDRYRHPAETLAFFGLQPEMTVIEIAPGGGWYTEILAPLLTTQGQYIGAGPKNGATLDAWLKLHTNVAERAKSIKFSPPDVTDLGNSNSVDMVLTFRNVHNWMGKNGEKKAFAAFFKVLKPGGVLGVVEHRANSKSRTDTKGESGYVRESDVIRLATRAGFTLDKKSEINANPKDTKDYPEGVWTLPPSLALKDKDRQKYLDIGESDRMTLRFVKPVAKVK